MWKTRLFALLYSFVIIIKASFASAATITFPKPIASENFPDLIKKIADAVVTVGVPLAVVALIFAGFKFITGSISGDVKALEEAKKIFAWTLIGTAIIVGAWALATAAHNFAIQL